MIEEIIKFSKKYMDNFKEICSIDDKVEREGKSIEYLLFIDKKMKEIRRFGNSDFKYAVNKFSSYIMENLNTCSFEDDENIRKKLKEDYLKIFGNNIIDVIINNGLLKESNKCSMKKVRFSNQYTLHENSSNNINDCSPNDQLPNDYQ